MQTGHAKRTGSMRPFQDVGRPVRQKRELMERVLGCGDLECNPVLPESAFQKSQDVAREQQVGSKL